MPRGREIESIRYRAAVGDVSTQKPRGKPRTHFPFCSRRRRRPTTDLDHEHNNPPISSYSYPQPTAELINTNLEPSGTITIGIDSIPPACVQSTSTPCFKVKQERDRATSHVAVSIFWRLYLLILIQLVVASRLPSSSFVLHLRHSRRDMISFR